ncbi:uncharacterized protein K02A2.6-like [Leguminivora glycinivorella]|uniref:uncharacterized protein K02A2.6-like n=1 Tax=Leguminivora glycinivorella TaxID=1035111 RepID=UPI00200E435F|nr:uncharacterized protein K02A2.6-like [Leguminivora glycinivorella]
MGTRLDDSLSKVINFILNGWPNKIQNTLLKPYYDNRNELAVENDLVLKGHKLVIPQSMRTKIIEELHRGHLGAHKMKAQARDRFWWPRLSQDIEECVATCRVCAALRPAPARAPLTPWPFPPHSWHRVHMDLLGPINNRTFLVIVDAFSKWVECFEVSNNYSTRVIIERLSEVMARFGIFNVICSDNGSYFISKEFKEFCARNGIQHITSPSYSPASNGQAESYIKIIKRAIKGIIMSGSSGKDLNVKIQEFLFHYRNSTHSTTDRSPSELLFGRKLRSRLDLIAPPVASSSAPLDVLVKEKQCRQIEQYRGSRKVNFAIGEQVLVQVYINQNRQLVKGKILKKLGSSVYIVQLVNLNRNVKKHTNQILKYKGEEEHVLYDSQPAVPATVQPRVTELAKLSQPSPAADSVADDFQIPVILKEHPAITEMSQTAPPTDHIPDAGTVDNQPDQVEQEADGDRSQEYEDAQPETPNSNSETTVPPVEPQATEPIGKRLRKIVDYKQFF